MTEISEARALGHRTANAEITLTLDGEPLAGHEVELRQVRHQFLFGCTGFEFADYANGTSAQPERDERMLDLWEGLFNFATLPFYWGRFEPERGKPDTQRLLTAARWLTERGHKVKGHPLAWHTVTADWLLDLDNAAIAQVQADRIRREVADFAGVIDTWDVINEAVIMPIFDKYDNGITRLCRDIGRIPMVRMVFDAARETNPNAVLLLNDFDMSAAFECLIEGVLEAGVKIDVLGLQSHMHQGYWGEEKTLGILDRFARYGLPIHFTETTIVSGSLMPPEIEDLNDHQVDHWPSTPEGEARQADEIERHYRTLVSHPAVEAITYWGMGDDGMWLGAPGGFVRADGTPKPSYDRLHRLVNEEWGTPATRTATDAEGRLRCDGFLGEYAITWRDKEVAFTLDAAGEQRLTVELG